MMFPFDVHRRDLVAQLRTTNCGDLHAEFMRADVTRAFVIYENGCFTLSHQRLLAPIRAFLEVSKDFASHEAVFIGREDGVPTLFFAFVHDTRRGLAQGGLRLVHYESMADVLTDGLRLSQGMTRKNALAGLWWGGGKGIIPLPAGVELAPTSPQRQACFEAYGRFVASLGGVYYTAEDMNTSTSDMDVVLTRNRFTTCISRSAGGSGNPSPFTARGVLRGIQAGWFFLTGSESLKDISVAVQGVGNVGAALVDLLVDSGATVIAADPSSEALARLSQRHPNVRVVDPQAIFDVRAEILAPCARGGQINAGTIPRLRVRLVCGAANNILGQPEDATLLAQHGITFVPDYVCNRMGITNCADEWLGYLEADVALAAERVYPDVLRVLRHARSLGVSTVDAANELADIAASDLHPLMGHRGRRIIDHLIDSGWHRPVSTRAVQASPRLRLFEPAVDEPQIRIRWERTRCFDGGPMAVAAAPVSAASSPNLDSLFSPLLMDVRARSLAALGRAPRRVVGSESGGLALQLAVERWSPYDREDLGRAEFRALCADTARRNDATIRAQMEALGIGFDPRAWIEPADDSGRLAAESLYFALVDAGMVTRERRMTNRCPRCATVLVSQDVVRDSVVAEQRYRIAYLAAGREAIQATTYYPELALGAVAIAVRTGGRFAHLTGQEALNALSGRRLPIVEVDDLRTDAEFLVPAHDASDARIAERHGLHESIRVYDERGSVVGLGPSPLGIDDARRLVLERLGQAVGIEAGRWPLDIGRCRRCRTRAIPEPSTQVFMRLTTSRAALLNALDSGTVTLSAKRWDSLVRSLLGQWDAWCFSRQQWWGHEIPTTLGAQGAPFHPVDVFSTWFTSVAATLAAAGWPREPRPEPIDEVFVDTDRLLRWAVPSLLVSLVLTGRPAFRHVMVHGTLHVTERRLRNAGIGDPLANDEDRFTPRVGHRQMRRALGNVVEPVTLVRRFGADSLRLGYLLCLRQNHIDHVIADEGNLRKARRSVRALAAKSAGIFGLARRLTPGAAELDGDRWIVAVAERARDASQAALRQAQFGRAAQLLVDTVDMFAIYSALVADRFRQHLPPGAPAGAAAAALRAMCAGFAPLCPFIFDKIERWLDEHLSEVRPIVAASLDDATLRTRAARYRGTSPALREAAKD